MSSSVRIDVDELLAEQSNALAEAKRELETEEELIQAIKAERKAKRARAAANPEGAERPRKRPRKSAIDLDPDQDTASQGERKPALPISAMKEKKIRISLAADKAKERKPRPIPREVPVYPCILCPNTEIEGLLPVLDPNDLVRGMGRSGDGIVRAHRACVDSIAEVWVDSMEVEGRVEAIVMGINGIPKDRWLVSGACSFG
jgi:hypothetical protein